MLEGYGHPPLHQANKKPKLDIHNRIESTFQPAASEGLLRYISLNPGSITPQVPSYNFASFDPASVSASPQGQTYEAFHKPIQCEFPPANTNVHGFNGSNPSGGSVRYIGGVNKGNSYKHVDTSVPQVPATAGAIFPTDKGRLYKTCGINTCGSSGAGFSAPQHQAFVYTSPMQHAAQFPSREAFSRVDQPVDLVANTAPQLQEASMWQTSGYASPNLQTTYSTISAYHSGVSALTPCHTTDLQASLPNVLKEVHQEHDGGRNNCSLDWTATRKTMGSNHMDATQLDVVWDGFRYLYAPRLAENVFQLSPKPIQILKKLSTDACADLQFLLNDGDPSPASALHPSAETLTSKRIRPSETVSVIIYGPEDLAEVVGRWLGKMNLYLQTPRACSQDVRYRNPQSFAFYDNQIILTSQLPSAASGSEHIDEQAPTDPFAALYNESVLEEAPQPHAIASSLHRHQRQALTFMGRREEGWNYLGSGDSIWQSYVDRFGVTKYKDTVSGLTQEHEPDMFRGGIIADEMGLGKTCSMLALIAANPSTIQPTRPDRPTYFQGPALKATLIVVPFPLLFVWEKQILEHFRRGSTQHLIYYGTARSQALCFDKFDIVITTYNIVGQEWQSYKSPQTSQAPRKLFEREWHRIVLDEAHVIRNPGRICAKSVCALRSERRWCITGTPIQNHLTDLSSLFRFLRLHPYNKRAVWDEHILKPWKSQADVAALKKLQKIMKTIAIRRTSSIINLPLRHEIAIEVSFSPEERAHYEHACKGVLDVLDAASESSTSIGSVYLNTFQRINDMRYICNHGLRPPRPHSARHLNKASITSSQSFQELGFDALEDALESLCIQCGLEIVDSEESVLNLLTENEGSSDVSPAQLCRACLSSDQTTNSPLPLNESSSPSRPSSPRPGGCLSSKLRALVDEILKLPPDDKCVIFSYWTTSLDAVQEALRPLGVQFCRYDGKLTRQQREAVLGRFASDQTTKVFLVSISCGGQGLDLTAANHAFLLEPQWNPMLEEQAMARIHRLGQKKPVRCVRFLVKNTWEEKIVILQRRKRNLAGLVVDRSPVKEGVVGKKHLYYLRELIG